MGLSLLAHELLCLRLQSFYGVQPCSPSRKPPTERALSKRAGKNLRRTSSPRFSKLR
jgi:hypothetical protein